MNGAPLVLGVNRTQDASICLMRGSQLEWAIQKERLTRQKHRQTPMHALIMPPFIVRTRIEPEAVA